MWLLHWLLVDRFAFFSVKMCAANPPPNLHTANIMLLPTFALERKLNRRHNTLSQTCKHCLMCVNKCYHFLSTYRLSASQLLCLCLWFTHIFSFLFVSAFLDLTSRGVSVFCSSSSPLTFLCAFPSFRWTSALHSARKKSRTERYSQHHSCH